MLYREQAAEARRLAQIAREEADVSEGFRKNELLDHAAQLSRRAEMLERFADEEGGS